MILILKAKAKKQRNWPSISLSRAIRCNAKCNNTAIVKRFNFQRSGIIIIQASQRPFLYCPIS